MHVYNYTAKYVSVIQIKKKSCGQKLKVSILHLTSLLDEIQEYRMVLYPWEGGIFREKVKKVKAHPF
jgi:hypothetical protein